MAAPEHSDRQLSRRYSWLALALAIIAGAVDGIGFLLLNHIFTSHVSGNTVSAAMQTAAGSWAQAWRHFEPVVIFFAAVVAGLALTDLLIAVKLARAFAVIAGIEAALLLAFYFLARPEHQWMVVFPSAAMGIQNAMLRRVGHHRVRTTFVTGMITNTAEGLVNGFQSAVRRDGKAREHFGEFLFYGSIWFCFAIGGISGAFIDLHGGTVALLEPICALALLAVFDLIVPLTKTPKDQADGK